MANSVVHGPRTCGPACGASRSGQLLRLGLEVVDLGAWCSRQHDAGIERHLAGHRRLCVGHTAGGLAHGRLVTREDRGVTVDRFLRGLEPDVEERGAEAPEQRRRDVREVRQCRHRRGGARRLSGVGDCGHEGGQVLAIIVCNRRASATESFHDLGRFVGGQREAGEVAVFVCSASYDMFDRALDLDWRIGGALQGTARVLEI